MIWDTVNDMIDIMDDVRDHANDFIYAVRMKREEESRREAEKCYRLLGKIEVLCVSARQGIEQELKEWFNREVVENVHGRIVTGKR